MGSKSHVFTKRDYRYFDMAKQQANLSTFDGTKVGCVIVYHNHVIGAGFNSNKTHPQQKRANKKRKFRQNKGVPIQHFVHAEIAAYNSIPYPVKQDICWRNVKVYVFRIAPGLPLRQGCSRPCPGCMSELTKLGIKNMYYSTDTGFAYEEVL